MRTTLLCLTLAISGCAAWTKIAPDDPRVRFGGRVDRTDPAGPRFSNTSTSVAVRVSAPAVRFHLRERPFTSADGRREPDVFELLIDGAPAGSVTAREPEWTQTVELEPGEHVVELHKRTEPEVGQAQLLGIELPWGGQLLPPPPPPARRIEVIGDSHTAGFGNLGPGPNCKFSAATEDGYRAYAARVARELNAELHIVAWSGRGVVRNYDLSTADTVPVLWTRALPEDPKSRWDFSTWTPDVVVIYLGANDWGQPKLDDAAFVRGYVDMVTAVRREYPKALILCGVVGMTDDWPVGERAGTRNRAAMDEVMKRLSAASIANVKTFTFERAAPEYGLGCLWHASVPTHQAAAKRLRELLASELGWRD